MATRKDVAKLAQVSEATVSYVINDSKNVTPPVRERVLAAARDLSYRPNLVARSLVTSHTGHVAILVDNLRNPYYSEILEGAQYVASRNGYIVSVVSVGISDMETVIDLAARGVDGVIITLQKYSVNTFLNESIPWVTQDRYAEINYRDAVFDMIAHLVALGHRDIAFLCGLPLSWSINHRQKHYLEALEHHQLPVRRELMVGGEASLRTDERAGENAMQQLLDRKEPFSAVFALNDLMAVGAAKAIRNAGLRVGEDISLIGCDHLSILDWCDPPLSTLDVQVFELGRALMESLIANITRKERIPRVIDARYIPKGSVSSCNTIWFQQAGINGTVCQDK